MKFQPPDLQKFQHVCGPKVSKGRSESPLVAPGGAKSPALAGTQGRTRKKTKQKPLTTVGSGESRFFAMLDAKPRYFLFCPFTQAKPFLNEGIQR